MICAVGYFLLRVTFVLSSRAFETPDTQSYRSGQATRPPVSAALLSWLGDTPYIALSAIVSTAGFLAIAMAVWNPARRKSYSVLAGLAVVSFLPAVTVYEHWLVPDSLLMGLSLLGLALAIHHTHARWHPWALVAICVLITTTKEQGIGVVVLIALVLVARRSLRVATVAMVSSALIFATVVMPCSNRQGLVLWHGPRTTELTMERFRIITAALFWDDLSPELAQVNDRLAECGMTDTQLIAETFNTALDDVGFENCPKVWAHVDDISQLDVLVAHLKNPSHVGSSLERGFAPDLYPQAVWSAYPFEQQWVYDLERWPMGALALLPLAALAVCVMRRRGRVIAMTAVTGSLLALVAVLVDPTSQDRHTIVFRIMAGVLAIIAITEATGRNEPDIVLTPDATVDDDREADLVPV